MWRGGVPSKVKYLPTSPSIPQDVQARYHSGSMCRRDRILAVTMALALRHVLLRPTSADEVHVINCCRVGPRVVSVEVWMRFPLFTVVPTRSSCPLKPLTDQSLPSSSDELPQFFPQHTYLGTLPSLTRPILDHRLPLKYQQGTSCTTASITPDHSPGTLHNHQHQTPSIARPGTPVLLLQLTLS